MDPQKDKEPLCCARCGLKYTGANRTSRFFKFHWKLSRSDTTLLEALQEVFTKLTGGVVCPFPSPKYREQDERLMCRPCASKLGVLHRAFSEFLPEPGADTYVNRQLSHIYSSNSDGAIEHSYSTAQARAQGGNDWQLKKISQTVSIGVNTVSEAKQKKEPTKLPPLRKTILKGMKSIKGRQVVNNLFYQILYSEMREFTAHSSLNQKITTLDDIPDWNEVRKELGQYAPTSLIALNAMAGSSDTETPLTPSLGTVVGILSNLRNTHCNKVQKSIGLVLRQSHTKQSVFDFLFELRVSASAGTVTRTIEELGGAFDARQLMRKKKKKRPRNLEQSSGLETKQTSENADAPPPPKKKKKAA